MKISRIAVLGALLLGLCTAGRAHAQTVVTFDDLTGVGLVPEGYGGLNWGPSAWTHYGTLDPPFTPHSPSERVYSDEVMTPFTFITPDTFDGAWFAGQSDTTVRFDLYDGSDTLIGSSGTLTVNDTPTFLASGYAGLVKTVRVVTNRERCYVMDDVTYGKPDGPPPSTPMVPEPSSLCLLMGMAVSGAPFLLRRRRA